MIPTNENVSLDRNVIYILQTKSGQPREIPLAPTLKEVLLAMLPRHSGPVFDVPVITLRRYFEQALTRAGIPSCRFHDLRHTFASLLVSAGESLPVVGALLGHTQAKTTSRYAHLRDDPLRRAAERVAAITTNGKTS